MMQSWVSTPLEAQSKIDISASTYAEPVSRMTSNEVGGVPTAIDPKYLSGPFELAVVKFRDTRRNIRGVELEVSQPEHKERTGSGQTDSLGGKRDVARHSLIHAHRTLRRVSAYAILSLRCEFILGQPFIHFRAVSILWSPAH